MEHERYRGKTDEEIVALVLADNSAHYEYLIRQYENKLARYVERIAFLRKDDVKDIVQETFIKAYRHLNDFDVNLKFSSWIYRIAHNETMSFLRKMKVRPMPESELATAMPLENISSDINPESDLDKKLVMEYMESVLNQLDPKYRAVLVLRYFEEKNYQEISDILQKPMGTVATLLKRAKVNLKSKIPKSRIA